MTFKHAKFEDSSTMRSLVKVAQDKGWIKEEPLSKQAAVKTADLQPTTNLMENVIKLCNGLRQKGFTKYADELETNLFTYKQAQTLYEVSKEKGDDLLGEAHPQGSHKLEDVDSSEAVVEDLVDKHKKIVQVVEKKPSGKLASPLDVLKAVRIVLGQEMVPPAEEVAAPDEETKLTDPYAANAEKAKKYLQILVGRSTQLVNQIIKSERLSDITYAGSDPLAELAGITEPRARTGLIGIKTTKGHLEGVVENLNELAASEPSQDSVSELTANLNQILELIRKAKYIDPSMKSRYMGATTDIKSKTGNVLKILRGAGVGQTAPTTTPGTQSPADVASSGMVMVCSQLVSTLESYLSNDKVKRVPQALQWAQAEIQEIKELSALIFAAKSAGTLAQRQGEFVSKVKEKQSEVTDFANKVIHTGA